MTPLETILAVFCALLLTGCCVLIIKRRKTGKEINELSDGIEEYLKSGKTVLFNSADNDFSRLHNDVADLCTALDLQKQNNHRDNIKNAQFAADVSHQLKTPLAGIRLYCEMAQANNPTEGGEKQLELLDKTERLVYYLLRLQKLKADAYEMNFEKNSIEAVIENAAEPFRALYPEKQIEITGSAVLRCDGEWLAEAFGNIIKNACEHTKADGKITVKIERTESAVNITFEDDGGGADESELPRLFERFYKSESSDENSTGLGLAIAKEITEKHHGIITAENTANGLKTAICLPIIDGAEKIY